MSDDATIHLRVPAELKGRWVRKSRAEGKRLTDWIVEKVEGHKMITNIELKPSGVEKFNRFFAKHARDGLDMQVVALDVLNVLQERVSMDESLVYELGRFDTKNGNPEILTLDPDDVAVTEDPAGE